MWNFDEMSREDLVKALNDALMVMSERYQEAKGLSKDSFQAGRELAYFETLDILRSRIEINGGQMDEVLSPTERAHAPGG